MSHRAEPWGMLIFKGRKMRASKATKEACQRGKNLGG